MTVRSHGSRNSDSSTDVPHGLLRPLQCSAIASSRYERTLIALTRKSATEMKPMPSRKGAAIRSFQQTTTPSKARYGMPSPYESESSGQR